MRLQGAQNLQYSTRSITEICANYDVLLEILRVRRRTESASIQLLRENDYGRNGTQMDHR